MICVTTVGNLRNRGLETDLMKPTGYAVMSTIRVLIIPGATARWRAGSPRCLIS
jgi:hypothetical protein